MPVEFVKQNLAVAELDLEFYFEIKEKILRAIQGHRRRALQKAKDQAAEEAEKEVLGKRQPKEQPQINQKSQGIQSKLLRESSVKIISKNSGIFKKESVASLNRKESLPLVRNTQSDIFYNPTAGKRDSKLLPGIDKKPVVASMNRTNELSKSNTTMKTFFNSKKNSQATILPPINNSIGSTSHSLQKSNKDLYLEVVDGNKYLRKKPFSWMNYGNNFNMASTQVTQASDSLYLTDPLLEPMVKKSSLPNLQKENERGKKSGLTSLNSSKLGFGEKSDKIENEAAGKDLMGSCLQVKEPYLLERQSDFYRKTIYPKTPLQQLRENRAKEIASTLTEEEALKEIEDQIKRHKAIKDRYKSQGSKNFVSSHSKGMDSLENEDFIKHIKRNYKPLWALQKNLKKDLQNLQE